MDMESKSVSTYYPDPHPLHEWLLTKWEGYRENQGGRDISAPTEISCILLKAIHVGAALAAARPWKLTKLSQILRSNPR